jgi:hypothetical protein
MQPLPNTPSCDVCILQPRQTAPSTELYGAPIQQLFQEKQLGHLLPLFERQRMDKAALMSASRAQLNEIVQGELTTRDWIVLNELQRELAQQPRQ